MKNYPIISFFLKSSISFSQKPSDRKLDIVSPPKVGGGFLATIAFSLTLNPMLGTKNSLFMLLILNNKELYGQKI